MQQCPGASSGPGPKVQSPQRCCVWTRRKHAGASPEAPPPPVTDMDGRTEVVRTAARLAVTLKRGLACRLSPGASWLVLALKGTLAQAGGKQTKRGSQTLRLPAALTSPNRVRLEPGTHIPFTWGRQVPTTGVPGSRDRHPEARLGPGSTTYRAVSPPALGKGL